MAIINFPPSLDLSYYRQIYPELRLFPDNVLMEHYKRFAVEQGHSTCIYDRREALQILLQSTIDNSHLKALEISPWHRPFISGANVKYFGTADHEALQKSAMEMGLNTDRIPKRINFISSKGDLRVVNETFDIVFSSHVIEHCPDLAEHFRGVSRILNAGGLYILIVPDKRYCFDYYHSESTISEVIDAFIAERKFPRLADVINLAYTRTHNDALRHWLGEHGERYGYREEPLTEGDARVEILGEYFFDDGSEANFQDIAHLVEKYAEAFNKGAYISTHNWRFTPDSFGYIVNMLNKLQIIDLQLYRLCHTLWGRQEFIAILEKP